MKIQVNGRLRLKKISGESVPCTAFRRHDDRYIYMACPWGPKGGGMFKVADYLIQGQSPCRSVGAAELRHLDTRGGGSATFSLLVLATALIKLVRGRISGRLCGVHVNVAERLSLFRKSAVIILSHALGMPVVLHLHAQLHHSYRRMWWPVQAVVRWVFSLASGCVVLGANARHFVIDELRVPPDRVDIVLNGVPEPVEVRRARRTGSAQRVLFLGNLSKLKGVSDILEALAMPELDTSRLEVIFAGGGDIPAYRAQAKDLHVDDVVRFQGWVDQHEAAQLMACADVLVLPSYVEGLPLVILEALANGVAVVCSPVGEIPSVLTDGVNACFVRPGDVRGIAACLQRLLEQPALMESLEKNGRALYDEKFSLTRFFRSVACIHQRYFGTAGEPLRSDPDDVAVTGEFGARTSANTSAGY